MSTLVEDPQARQLLLLLWNAEDRDSGIAIVDLPEALRDESLLSACHGDGLIVFIRRNHCHAGGELVLEKGWNVAELSKPNRAPVWALIRKAMSEKVDDRIRHRVRLSNRGCDVTGKLALQDPKRGSLANRKDDAMDDLIQRLLAGPIDTDLSDREIAHLDAHLSQRRSLRELADLAKSKSLEKLRAIKKYNVKLRELQGNTGKSAKPLAHPALDLAQWCREAIEVLTPLIGAKDDERYEFAEEPPTHLRQVTTEFVRRLVPAGFAEMASDINISSYTTAQRLIGLLSRFEGALSSLAEKARADQEKTRDISLTQSSSKSIAEHGSNTTRQRPCHARDELWLSWYEEIGSDSANVFGQIRDRWNSMPDSYRNAYAPCGKKIGKGKAGYDTVRKAIEAAKSDGGKF